MSLIYLLTWRSLLEIIAISTFIYHCLWWLATDKTKTIIFYFYCYAITLFISFFFHLFTIADFLLFALPVFLTLLVIIHSDLLQRNFVSLKKIIQPHELQNHLWIDELLRACLKLRNQGIDSTFVIENSDSLVSFIDVNCPINTKLNQPLLEILTSVHKDNFFTLLTRTGTIIGALCKWKTNTDYHEYAAKLDCIILSSDIKGFTIVCQGKVIDQLTAPQVNTILKHTILSMATINKGEPNDANANTIYKKSTQQQSHS